MYMYDNEPARLDLSPSAKNCKQVFAQDNGPLSEIL